MTILLIDDDPVTTRLLELTLDRERLESVSVQKVSQAIDWLTEHLATLVVTDVNLDGPSGMDLLSTLRSDRRWRRQPVIMVTGSADRGIVEEAGRLGVRHFLVKPVRPILFVRRIREALAELLPIMSGKIDEMARLGLWEHDYRTLLETSRAYLTDLARSFEAARRSGDHVLALDVAGRLREPATLLGAERCVVAVADLASSAEQDREGAEAAVAYELQGLLGVIAAALEPGGSASP